MRIVRIREEDKDEKALNEYIYKKTSRAGGSFASRPVIHT